MTPEQVESMRPYTIRLIEAVRSEDLARVESVYRKLEQRFGAADGAHAAAMLLADELLRERRETRERLIRANNESAKFAQAYMDLRRKQVEWQEINEKQAERIHQLREGKKVLA